MSFIEGALHNAVHLLVWKIRNLDFHFLHDSSVPFILCPQVLISVEMAVTWPWPNVATAKIIFVCLCATTGICLG